MTMTDDIRLRADGSIDVDFYLARGRRMRSETAHAMVGQARRRKTPRRPVPPLLRWGI